MLVGPKQKAPEKARHMDRVIADGDVGVSAACCVKEGVGVVESGPGLVDDGELHSGGSVNGAAQWFQFPRN